LIAGPGHPVSDTLKEGDSVAGFSVLEVPGHALEYWSSAMVVFGLRVPSGRARLQLPPKALTPDPRQNLESARRLAALKPAVVCFGHGPPLHDGKRFCEFVAGASVGAHEPADS